MHFFKSKIRRLKQIPNVTNVVPFIPATLTAHISALRTPRNIKTRGVTIAEHNPEIEKTARIAGILRELCEELTNYKGELHFHVFISIPYTLFD